MFTILHPVLAYIGILSILIAADFGIGIFLGFEIHTMGDILATLLVGLSFMVVQGFFMPAEVDMWSWAVNTGIGALVGVALSFLLIMLLVRSDTTELDYSHAWSFPLVLLGIVVFQFRYLTTIVSLQVATTWVVDSLLGFAAGFVFLAGMNRVSDLDLDILQDREVDYGAIAKWAFMGLVIGFMYTLFTARTLGVLYGSS